MLVYGFSCVNLLLVSARLALVDLTGHWNESTEKGEEFESRKISGNKTAAPIA